MPARRSPALSDLASPAALRAREADVRNDLLEAALMMSGELGYRETSVRSILEYSGHHRPQFYKHFENRNDCFVQAYRARIDQLCTSLLEEAAAAPGWEAGVREAIAGLFRFVNGQSTMARALFVEAQIAGEPALAPHDAAVERLAVALDGIRGEIPPEQAPPAVTGTFVIAGIESCVAEALSENNPVQLWGKLPELMHFVVGSYFDRDAAENASERAGVALRDDRPRLVGAHR